METRILNDLSVTGSIVFAKNETELPANPREGEVVLMDGRHYAYTRLASNYYSWMPITVKQSSYIHSQGIESTTWTIPHNLGTTHYGIFIYDIHHNVVIANHSPIDENTVEVTLAAAMRGTAVIFAVTDFGATNFTATQLDIGGTPLTGDGTDLLVNGSPVLTIDSASTYTLPPASASTLGGVMIGSGLEVSSNGVISALATPLSAATGSVLGGVKIGSNITNNSGTISITDDNVVSALGFTPVNSAAAEFESLTISASDNSVVGLFHMDGTPGVQTVVNSAVNSAFNTISWGTSTLSSTYTKFGSTASRGGFSTNEPFSINSKTLTIEGWLYYTGSVSDLQVFVLCYNKASGINDSWLRIQNDRTLVWADRTTSGSTPSSTVTVNSDTWNHIALVMTPTSRKVFLNGQLACQSTVNFDNIISFYNYTGTPGNFTLGFCTNASGSSNVWLDEVRISNVERYSSDFTVPASPFNTNAGVLKVGTDPVLLTSQIGVDVAGLVGGKIPASQIPSIAITNTFTVASESAMLSLTAEVGDVAIRTDEGKSYILQGSSASVLGNWVALTSNGNLATVASTGSFTDLTNVPTTLAGYGITDAYTKAETATAISSANILWSKISSKPTTISGYGITDAYTKTQVDTAISNATSTPSWSTITGKPTTVSGYGITDAYTKAYADSTYATKTEVQTATLGLDFKNSVVVATTGNIDLTGIQSIDGYTVQNGDRVLVKDQSSPAANGIYVVDSGAWSRAADAADSNSVSTGLFMYVERGTLNGGSNWVLSTTGTIVVGTTALTFTKFQGAGGSGSVNMSQIPYDFAAAVYGQPAAGATIFRAAIVRSMSFAADFAGSVALCDSAPSATAIVLVKKNGVQVGTVTFASGSTTGVFSCPSGVSFVSGDKLTLVAPASKDTLFGDIEITLAATLS